MEKRKAFVIMIPGFPANHEDDTCLPFPQLFVKTFQRLHPHLQVFVFAFQYPFIKNEYAFYGCRVIAFAGKNRGKLRRLLLWQSVKQRAKKICNEYDVEGILNFWLGEAALIGNTVARKHNIKSFTWLLGQDARMGNRYIRLVKPDTEHLIALSDFLAAELYRNYHLRPAHTIAPGIDTNEFTAFASARDIDLLGVGSLIPLKQFEVFIRVVATLQKLGVAVRAMICGKGAEVGSLQKIAQDLNVSENIAFAGELPHGAVLDLMQRAKILLHPSAYEGYATVINEALYAGAHVVSFCQPMEAVVNHHHVVHTEEQMIDCVQRLMSDRNLKHNRVLSCCIEDCCRHVSDLFGL